MKTSVMPVPVEVCIQAINRHDAAGFMALFASDCVVRDVGREHRGLAAIREWSGREIFGASVTFEVLEVSERDGETVVVAKIDGTFDRTGLPNPLIMEHAFTVTGGLITEWTCRLASA